MIQTVCHISSVHPRYDVRIFNKQCRSLVEAGFRVVLLVADGRGDSSQAGVIIKDIGRFGGRIQRMLIAPLKLFQAALKTRALIYQIHDPELLPFAYVLKRVSKAKLIYDSHEYYQGLFQHKEYYSPRVGKLISKSFGLLENFIVNRLDHLIITTQIHQQLFCKVPHRSIIYNYPREEDWLAPSPDNDSEVIPHLCYIGSITAERGISTLVQALEGLDCRLYLAGAYEPPSYREKLRQFPGWEKVDEIGYADRKKAAEIVSMSRVGMILLQDRPNYRTSLATKLFEYMMGSIPVIVSDFEIYRSILAEAGCGLLVDPADLGQIRQAIRYFLDNPLEATQMGKKGRETAAQKFSWKTEEAKLVNLYKTLLLKA